MFKGESHIVKGLAVAAVVATTAGFAGHADAARITQTQAVYFNSADQNVLSNTSQFTARDNGDGTFLVNIANILRSTRTELTGVYFESGFASLIDGGPTLDVAIKGTADGNARVNNDYSFSVGTEDAPQSDLIDWTGTALSVTAEGLGSGIANAQRLVMTFDYAEGVTFEDVEALIGGFGYRVASLVEDRNGAQFASTNGLFGNPDALDTDNGGGIDHDGPVAGNVTAVPTPSAFAAGLGLLALAGMKRRRDEA
ncbi:MAG: hypothetical protein AAGE65_04005 [Planctomycetota bacterium]